MILRLTTTAAITAAFLAPTAAHAAKSPWKIVKTTRLKGSVELTDLAVGGERSAWAFGTRTGEFTEERIAYHWDGRKWRGTALPKSLAPMDPAMYGDMGTALSASSATNAWAFAHGTYGSAGGETDPCAARAAGGLKIKRAGHVLRWNGGRWVVARVLKSVIPSVIVARGAKEGILFGRNAATDLPVVLRFDGRRWHSARMPFRVELAVAAGGSVWAAGFDVKTSAPDVRRWDGRRWTSTRLGRALPKEVAATKDEAGTSSHVSGLSVWKNKVTVSGTTVRSTLCGGTPAREERFLLTRDGGWRPLSMKGLGGLDLGDHVPDGRGGQYAIAFDRGDMENMRSVVLHRTAKGQWKREPLPRSVQGLRKLASAPGGRSVWLTGLIGPEENADAVILRRS